MGAPIGYKDNLTEGEEPPHFNQYHCAKRIVSQLVKSAYPCMSLSEDFLSLYRSIIRPSRGLPETKTWQFLCWYFRTSLLRLLHIQQVHILVIPCHCGSQVQHILAAPGVLQMPVHVRTRQERSESSQHASPLYNGRTNEMDKQCARLRSHSTLCHLTQPICAHSQTVEVQTLTYDLHTHRRVC